jgi:hypothetical protein
MSDDLHLGEVIEGYGVLADQLVTNWAPYVKAVSTKLAGGNYASTDAEADVAAGFKLAMNSMLAIGSEAIDAVSIMTNNYSEQTHLGGYHADPAYAGTVRTLVVAADLESASGQKLPKARVKPVPTTLAPNLTGFDLDVDGDGMKARTYDGVVVVTDAAGVVVEEIKVSVTIG